MSEGTKYRLPSVTAGPSGRVWAGPDVAASPVAASPAMPIPFLVHCVLSTVPNMTKRIQRVLGMAVLALTASACGPTFTPEEATAECDRLRNDLAACFTDEVYDQCVACHEECGRDCSLLDSCPHQFVCD